MLDKRVYNKAVAISEDDLKFLREIRENVFKKKSVAGVNSLIIEYYKKYGLPQMSKKIKTSNKKKNNRQGFEQALFLQPMV